MFLFCFPIFTLLFASGLEDPARPGYHYTRPYGWQNDPVPYYDSKRNTFHLFPLCNPNATTQWQLPSDHNAWCHASSSDGFKTITTHKPALMKGSWPGLQGVGGTGNIVELPPVDQQRLNATTAAITGGAWLWVTSDDNLAKFTSIGGLLDAGPDGAASPKSPVPGVFMCGDVHVYYAGSTWRIIMAGSDGNCMNASRTSTKPLALIYEAPRLQLGGWAYKGILYTGSPGDGPRLECPSYFKIENTNTSVLLFSKTGAPGYSTNGVYYATGEEVNGSFMISKTGRQQSGGYANEAFVRGNRLLIFSWISGVRGMYSCVNSLNQTLPNCFAGSQSLPREISLQNDGSLKFPVAREITALVGSKNSTTIQLNGIDSKPTGILITNQSRVQLNISLQNVTLQRNCTFGLDLFPHNSNPGLKVRVGVMSLGPGNGYTIKLGSAMGQNAGDDWGHIESMPLPLEDGIAEVEVWIDRSVVEVFGAKGAAVLASPTPVTSVPKPAEAVAFLTCNAGPLTLSIDIASVASIEFHSDRGPWNPKDSDSQYAEQVNQLN